MGSINGCRVRCSLPMSGIWSISDEETPKSKSTDSIRPINGPDNINELISTFKRLLESFLDETDRRHQTHPPMTDIESPVDLLKLFINVSHRGGFLTVSEHESWDEIGQELGFDNSTSAKLVYLMHLGAFNRLLYRVIDGDDVGICVELFRVSNDLVARFKDFVSQVKIIYEMRKGVAGNELGGIEFKWFISKAKGMYDKHRIGKEVQDEGSSMECVSSGKRKRECSLETLKWLNDVAKDPCEGSIGCLPDRSMWKSYGSEEPWKQLLLYRASRTVTDPSIGKNWEKLKKMHPSLYEDSAAGASYNLRERQSLNRSQLKEKTPVKGKTSSGNRSCSDSDEDDRPCALIGSEFQAEVPEWNDDITTESDTKWLGTQIWPLSKEQNNSNVMIERDRIGKGRDDHCGCQNPGSVECVRFHIAMKQEKLKLELGRAFYMWCFDVMGEGTLQYWTEYERKKVKGLMTDPPTLGPSFFDDVKRVLDYKSRAMIVSYFYNVILLQFRANQSRISPLDIDSDTEQLYNNIAIENENTTLEANAVQQPVRLSPKRKRRR